MKSVGTAYWNGPNSGAKNESGFSALPGGFRSYDGSFNYVRYIVVFWSATENYSNLAWYSSPVLYNSNFYTNGNYGIYNNSAGASVRCLKD